MTDEYRRYYFATERAARIAREYERALRALSESTSPPGPLDAAAAHVGLQAAAFEGNLTRLEAAAPGCGVELWPEVKL